jgi:nickel-dependent lactate racemase
MDGESIVRRIREPIGAPPLRALANQSRSAAIAVEDITRPGPTPELLDIVLSELKAGGLSTGDIWITVALGAHAPMHRSDLIKKLGSAVIENYAVYQSQPYENLAHLGTTSRGTPVHVSRFFVDADLKLSVGTIVPHCITGFSGGAKTVAIGMGGLETILANHRRLRGDGVRVGCVEGNACRADMEEIARMAGLRFIINDVVNSRRELAGVFAGDPIAAHRAGISFAREVYATHLPDKADVVVLNAYPKDTDLVQAVNTLNAVDFDLASMLKPGGSTVVVTASPQGGGVHYYDGIGMRGHARMDPEALGMGERGFIIFSPNLSRPEVRQLYPEETLVFNHWQQVQQELENRHGASASAVVFPCAAIQFPRQNDHL